MKNHKYYVNRATKVDLEDFLKSKQEELSEYIKEQNDTNDSLIKQIEEKQKTALLSIDASINENEIKKFLKLIKRRFELTETPNENKEGKYNSFIELFFSMPKYSKSFFTKESNRYEVKINSEASNNNVSFNDDSLQDVA